MDVQHPHNHHGSRARAVVSVSTAAVLRRTNVLSRTHLEKNCQRLGLGHLRLVNAHTISHYLQISVLSLNRTLYIECCSQISINLFFMSHCYFASIFYSIADVFYIINFIFFVTFHSMSHVRLSYV